MMFGESTALAIRAAEQTPFEKRTHIQKIILVLSDGRWHAAPELSKVTWKFGSRLSDMAQRGIEYEKRKAPTCPKGENYYEYRLKAVSDER